MEIAVIGGTGTFGRSAVDEFGRRGHAVRVLSRTAPSPATSPHRRVDLATGEGLIEALEGADVVVDASNTAGRKKQVTRMLVEGTRRLLAAEAQAGVPHHVLISIVGIDEVPMSYYRTKVEQKRLVREAPHAGSILRATQFHQLLDQIFGAFARFGVLLRTPIPLQPVDPREVAVAMADAIEAGPWEQRRELAGPEVHALGELARIWKRATGRRRPLVPLPLFGTAAAAARGGALCAPGAPRASLTFERWLGKGGEGEPPARPATEART